MKKGTALVICLTAVLAMTGCNGVGGFHAYSISSTSMQPTFYAGDKLFVDESYDSSHAVSDGDIIVFRHNGNVLIKRVTAMAGETIEGKNGLLLRNGVALDEPYAHHSDEPPAELQTFAARVVPADELFVTGDNRDFSLDSRLSEFGNVHLSDVMGKPAFIYSSSHGQTGRTF
jgi:signal peptidase I